MNTSTLHNNTQEVSQTENQLWTVQDVARFLKCSVRHVGNLQRMGLPFIKLRNLTRFDPVALKRWIERG